MKSIPINEYIKCYNYERPQERYRDQTHMEVRKAALSTREEISQYPIKENKRITKYYPLLKAKQLNTATI